MILVSLITNVNSYICNKRDYKGRDLPEEYIAIELELQSATGIIIEKQELIDVNLGALENYNYPFSGPASAISKKLIFQYKVPFENYYLKDGTVFLLIYKYTKNQKVIFERFIYKNEIWECENN